MTRFNTRVFCGACLVLAAVAYAAEVDFVCSVANSSSIVCADCNKFCTGCGITCNADGRITGIQWTGASIETLPETIADLTALESLNLNGNKLAALPAGLKGLNGLASNAFAEFPVALLELPKLSDLDLSGNKLAELPHTWKSAVGLKTLSLQRNAIASLPDSFCEATALKYLRLDDNKLATLPACLGTMQALKLLTASKNALTALPDLTNLTALTELALASNSFAAFPAAVCALPALAKLDLTLNKIATVPADCADTPVATLMLGRNAFTEFPAALTNWTHLQSLVLAHNHMQSIAPVTASSFPALHDIDVSYNCLNCDTVETVLSRVPAVTCAATSQHECGPASSSATPAPSSSAVPHAWPAWKTWAIVGAGIALLAIIIIIVVVVVRRRRYTTATGYEPINNGTF